MICPSVAATQAPEHAGTVDDELALLVVHGLLHVLGHDHVQPRRRPGCGLASVELLEALHWHGPGPADFRQDQPSMIAASCTGADIWMLVVILFLLVVLGFLAMAETALSRISKVKAAGDRRVVRHPRRRGSLARLASHPERFINALLVTVTICQTGQAFLTSILADRLFGTAGLVVAFILNVVVFFVLAEAVPKTYAILHPERAALFSTPATSVLVSFPPLQLISRGLIVLANVILPGKGLKQGPFVSEQELLGIVEAAAEDDVIEREERELIESIIEFGDTVAREVMTPRPDVVTVEHDATISERARSRHRPRRSAGCRCSARARTTSSGIAHGKDLMKAEREGRGATRPASAVARPARFIPENKPLNRLMREMQAEKFHLAIVVDEYGDIAGIVTLEDCLEELVGDIVDEFDREDREVVHLPDGSYLVDGGMSVGDLNDLLEIDLPDEDWDTVAGFVFSTLGHVPERGEAVEANGWRFAAEQLDGRRIRKVRVWVTGPRPQVWRTAPRRQHAAGDRPDALGLRHPHRAAQRRASRRC